jgi:hypothetical protein
MKVYNYSEARQQLAELLNRASREGEWRFAAAMGRPFWSARPRLPVHRWTCRATMRVSPGKKF